MARNVGIVASDCYFPSTYVAQEDLEQYDGIAAGKYTKGLGQTNMAFVGAGEDINSMCMSALSNLMDKYGLNYNDIGRLEVGTETIIDKSKSTKTSLMSLFTESGNSDVLGITNVNACYGGTSALFNTIDWVESSAWDGRYGVVLCGDIAVYEKGPARPTGGAGVVALLVGPNAPLTFENKLRSSHFEDAYDFYKPFLSSEYPAVDGHLSNSCYLRAVDRCYNLYTKKFKEAYGEDFDVFGNSPGKAQHALFHQPYTKLVQKSYARLMYNDAKRGGDIVGDSEILKEIAAEFGEVDDVASYTDRALDKKCVTASADAYNERVFPYTIAGRNLGNSYTGSLYFGLLSLIAQSDKLAKKDDRVLMFSYGSGLAATMFSAKIEGSLEEQRTTCNLLARLDDRVKATPEQFTEALEMREQFYTATDFEFPSVNDTKLAPHPGSFSLAGVDSMGRRAYTRSQSSVAEAASSRAFSTNVRAMRFARRALLRR
ncbi:Hydroxymethylglutaryl-CoA synthase [Hondaea fermentalgiana]|uniref:Hydroxymethylglutaryl-CoA synthase n=1 Tax=Hondaea fermentalgiana TaxID=2315210 RepID=A0A2R5G156_9STRA|nr:Hydroxymethylglutaryl-CoA synthase [Hondaea fermentalgiana]|eukprot:GBG24740.1 Hydroxymethylglutaryl-CoA synthase [Hondaea fermentalgiana]